MELLCLTLLLLARGLLARGEKLTSTLSAQAEVLTCKV